MCHKFPTIQGNIEGGSPHSGEFSYFSHLTVLTLIIVSILSFTFLYFQLEEPC